MNYGRFTPVRYGRVLSSEFWPELQFLAQLLPDFGGIMLVPNLGMGCGGTKQVEHPRGGGFDPGDAAAFAAASAPSLPGVPQGQSGFASRGG